MATCDKLIIGAGFYGLYSALRCGKRGQSVIVLERDGEPFMRASYINQARLHAPLYGGTDGYMWYVEKNSRT